MKKHWQERLILSFMLCLDVFAGSALRAETPAPEPVFSVHVYTLCDVPHGTVSAALRTAEWIFRRAGIAMRSSICARTEQGARNAEFCTASTLPVMITVKLLRQDMSERAGLPATKLGVALPNNQVYVFLDRVQRITQDSDFSRPLVLGHIIAHELGHVLLAGEGHSASGIMSERLVSAQCERPGVMRLAFTPEQAERMRAQIARLTHSGVSDR